MKKLVVLFILLAAFSGSAFGAGAGSAFGTLTTARTAGMGRVDFGAGVGIADATTVFGTLTYGVSEYTDIRVKGGLWDDNDDVNIALGFDLKWQLWDINEGRREVFDLSFGPQFEYIDLDGGSVMELGAFALGSYPFVLNGSGTLSPYAKFNTRIEVLSIDAFDDSDTDIRFGLNAGVEWQATSVVTLLGEFQIDGNDGVFFGATFNIQ